MRGLTARNRLWLPPMCMYTVEAQDGVVTDWHVVHYASRALEVLMASRYSPDRLADMGRESPVR